MDNAVDQITFAALNGLADTWAGWLAMLFSSRALGALVFAGLAAWFWRRRRPLVWRALLGMASAVALTDSVGARLLKPWFGRVRPNHALPPEAVNVLEQAANVGSMPSLHAANAFAVATAVTLLDRRLAPVVYPLAALVALSRVVLGVHWPTDVLAGAAYGSLMAGAATWLVRRGFDELDALRRPPTAGDGAR